MISKSKKFREVKPGDTFEETRFDSRPDIEQSAADFALRQLCKDAEEAYGDQLWIASVAVTVNASVGVITSEGECALAGGDEE